MESLIDTGGRTSTSEKSPRSGVLPFARSDSDRLIAGVAGGMGPRIGVDPFVIRVAAAVLTTAGGIGVIAYIAAWGLSGDPGSRWSGHQRRRLDSLRQIVAVGFIVLGTLLVGRHFGIWFADAIVWPAALAGFGSTVIWTRSDDVERARWTARFSGNPLEAVFAARISPTRLVIGGVLVAGGMAGFLAANDALGAARNLVLAVAVTASGLGLILGPPVWRLARQTVEERRERIRSEERAEMAAHLHDSVLQTLALIQRSESTREMTSLARLQERELRSWLYGKPQQNGEQLSVAVDEMAARVERLHQVKVESVVVGNCPLDDATRALLGACGEATINAAKHSGASSVDVYVEVENDEINAFIRDLGVGFDPSDVPEDRRGIAESITGRIKRHGGKADIVSAPGAGTEVRLSLPRTTA